MTAISIPVNDLRRYAEETAAPLEASIYSLPALSKILTPMPLSATE